jgi:molybdopterin-guanine dinucleotide biosynthesis protein A
VKSSLPLSLIPCSLTAIILAGGKSSRMGQDKALIRIKDRPLLQQISTLAQQCASQVYLITPWGERYQSILPKGCQIIKEILPPVGSKSAGPLVAFAQALTHVQTEWVLLLACDLPLLNQAEVQQWLGYLSQTPETALALLPRHRKGWEPLAGFYRRRCLSLLEEFIDKGGQSFQDWLAEHPVAELPVSNPQYLFNCNTPEDLEKL